MKGVSRCGMSFLNSSKCGFPSIGKESARMEMGDVRRGGARRVVVG